MEKIVIDFTANPQNINATIDLLEKIGKVDAVNAAQMRNNHDKYMEYSKQKLKVLGDEETAAGKAKKATESNFNSINNSINQLSRELPAFTYSMQTGFMAISNNIPALVDGLNQLKVKNAELAASGKATQTALSAVTSAIFSWQTAISIGITLLTVYGAEVGKTIMKLFEQSKALDVNTEAFKKNTQEIIDNYKSIKKRTEEVNKLRIETDDTETKHFKESMLLAEDYSNRTIELREKQAIQTAKLNAASKELEEKSLKEYGIITSDVLKKIIKDSSFLQSSQRYETQLLDEEFDLKRKKMKQKQAEEDLKAAKKDGKDLAKEKEQQRLNDLQALERWWESINEANRKAHAAFELDNKERFEERLFLEDADEKTLQVLRDAQKKRQDLQIKDSEWQKEFDEKQLKDRLKRITNAEREITNIIFQAAQAQIQNNIDVVDAKMNIQNRAIDQQKILAEQGMQNTLAFEIRRQDELERVRLEEQKKMKKAKELEIFLNALIKYTESEKNPLVAIVKAAGVVGAAKVAEAVYAEEGGVLGSMHSKSYVSMAGATRRHPGGGDVLVHAQKGEGFVSLNDMKNLQAGVLPKWMSGMMRVPFNHKLIPASPVGGSIDMSGIEKKLDSLELTIKNKKETTFAAEFIDNIPHIITKEIENGIARTTRQALTRF